MLTTLQVSTTQLTSTLSGSSHRRGVGQAISESHLAGRLPSCELMCNKLVIYQERYQYHVG